jgi:hypothetical protein
LDSSGLPPLPDELVARAKSNPRAAGGFLTFPATCGLFIIIKSALLA